MRTSENREELSIDERAQVAAEKLESLREGLAQLVMYASDGNSSRLQHAIEAIASEGKAAAASQQLEYGLD